jgi:hypothetical protein
MVGNQAVVATTDDDRVVGPLRERRHVVRPDQLVRDLRNRVLPKLRLSRDPRAETTLVRTQVAVGQLVPRTRECVGELVRMLEEMPRDPFIDRVHP